VLVLQTKTGKKVQLRGGTLVLHQVKRQIKKQIPDVICVMSV